MVKILYLLLYIVLVLLQHAVVICNGFVLYLFTKEKSIRQNSSRLLILLLATNDFLHAVATLPYTIYLLSSWNPVHLDLNPYYVMIASTPFIAQLKINLTLTIFIAAERILALSFPIMFRKLSSYPYTTFCLLLGFLLAIIDLIVEFSLSPFNKAPNCLSVGCFLSEKFSYYLGISNMAMGIVVIVLTVLILVKLRALQRDPQPLGVVDSIRNKYKRVSHKYLSQCRSLFLINLLILQIYANRNCTAILFISSIFVTLPSVVVGVSGITGFSLTDTVGPFYTAGLLCAGVCNGVVQVLQNKDMLRALGCKCVAVEGTATVEPVKTSSTRFMTQHLPIN